jgi:response regulator RpfG family c-di-GMP phosphodiesterase
VRPYKAAWSAKESLSYLESHAARHFDPRLVEVLARNRDEVVSIGERFADQLVP